MQYIAIFDIFLNLRAISLRVKQSVELLKNAKRYEKLQTEGGAAEMAPTRKSSSPADHHYNRYGVLVEGKADLLQWIEEVAKIEKAAKDVEKLHAHRDEG